jgi:alpha-maltose-1-phosphate synthase
VNYHLLCEGNAETRDAWSGSGKGVVDGLRGRGHVVRTADVDLRGVSRLVVAAASFRPEMDKWRTAYRLGEAGFRARSRRARSFVARHAAETDWVLQIGATFDASSASLPHALYCDSNIWMAKHLKALGHTHAAWMSEAQFERVARREQVVYDRARVIFTISDRLRRSFIEDFRIPADRVHAVYAGANIDGAFEQAVRKYQKEPHPPRIFFLGRHFERKGGPELLQAFRRVRSEMPDAELIVAGSPVTITEPGVQCFGWLEKEDPATADRLAWCYGTASVFCLPTRFDAFGIVFVEAMQFGIPCVGTDIVAVPEIIDDGKTGFLVKPGDADAIAAHLLTLLRQPELAKAMGERGRARVHERFAWSTVADRITSVLSAT